MGAGIGSQLESERDERCPACSMMGSLAIRVARGGDSALLYYPQQCPGKGPSL